LDLIEVVIPEWLSPLLLQSEKNNNLRSIKSCSIEKMSEGQEKHQAENKLQLTTS
jgi:hypothetical protein